MSSALSRWWSSVAFRQALIFGALVVVTMTVLLVIFYVQTVGVWQRRIDSQIDTTTQRLVEYHERRGSAALAGHINNLLGDGIDSDTEVYSGNGSSVWARVMFAVASEPTPPLL